MIAAGNRYFEGRLLKTLLDQQLDEMIKEIYSLRDEQILGTSPDEMLSYFREKFDPEIPELQLESITTDSKETNLDAHRFLPGFSEDFGPPPIIKGTRIEYYIPFSGDGSLFNYQPSSFSGPPTGLVTGNEFVIGVEFRTEDADSERVERIFKSELEKVEKYLNWQRNDVRQYRETLAAKAKALLDSRKKKLTADREILVKIGRPTRRDNAPTTYRIPERRRKLEFKEQSISPVSRQVEWSLDMQEYEHILSVLEYMVEVMEYSPRAFSTLDEESLRSHFLVQLNGQYDGTATAETFNFDGKTDIIIKEQGKNIFVAECKFWSGPTAMKDTIDQILRYLTWRDTKAAIIIFNKNKRFSEVLKKIPESVRGHPGFDRQLDYDSDRGFRFEMHKSDDPEKRLLLTVLAFDIPSLDEA